jgi:hypothetical protein
MTRPCDSRACAPDCAEWWQNVNVMCESRPENLDARRQNVLYGILLVLIGLPGAVGVGVAMRAQTPGPSAGGPVIDNERVTVWDTGAARGSSGAPSVTGLASVEIALAPTPGAVVFRANGRRAGDAPPPGRTVIVDLKDHPVPPLANTSGFPNAFPRPHVKKVLENARAIVWDYSWTKGEPTPMHFHDKDVVVTYLEDGGLQATTPAGERTLNQYTAGAIRYNSRDRTHTEELVNGRQRAIIVELK